jgi:hypothetical protein
VCPEAIPAQSKHKTALTSAKLLRSAGAARSVGGEEFILEMEMLCCAYGMLLESSFPLAGIEHSPRAEQDLPVLRLALQQADELRASWEASAGPPEWRGRLGDGIELTIEHGRSGDLLFAYGDLACFHLSAGMTDLCCVPATDGLGWQQTLIGKVLPAISVMRGYEALHAATVEGPEGVIAIMAPSGTGKTTLALELMSRGMPLFADDVCVLSGGGKAVTAWPGTAHMNVGPGRIGTLDPGALGNTLALLAGERWMVAHEVARGPRLVSMLCILERGEGRALQARHLPAGPLPLAPYMLGLAMDPGRQRGRFELYADLSASCTLVALEGGPEHGPGELAELLLQVMSDGSAMSAGVSP